MVLMLDRVFPRLMSRMVPKVKASTPTVVAIWTLLSSKMEALPITLPENSLAELKSVKAISGYSIISRLLETDRLSSVLQEPSENNSLTIGSVSLFRDDLVSLLHVFEATTFGYAALESSDREKDPSLIFIHDLLDLYITGHISSDLSANDVASSPIFTVSNSSTLRDTLREMLNRKFRRVLLKDSERQVITDRDILEFLFARRRLEDDALNVQSVQKALDSTMAIIHPKAARKISSHDSIRNAAQVMLESGNGFVLCASGLITPWDLIIKPWRLGHLQIRNPNHKP
jgi:CBS domain-containing protein